MSISVKFNLKGFCSRRILLIIVLLLVMSLIFSCFIATFTGRSIFVSSMPDKIVSNEVELVNAVNNANGCTVIALNNDIMLTLELRISAGKDVELISNGDVEFKVVGANDRSTIIIENGGVLRLGGIVVTHAKNVMGRGVTVNLGGTLIMSGGEISNNNINRGGGGVNNNGNFTMFGGKIVNNVAVDGGGVYSVNGTFRFSGGEILGNTAESHGGGIYINFGEFSVSGGLISKNTATWGGGVCVNYCTNVRFSNVIISDNTAKYSGGGVDVYLNIFYVSDGVIFSNNKAYWAYNRDAKHDEVYNSNIGSNVTWTFPFTQGYNNYDIRYTEGEEITNSTEEEVITNWLLYVVITSLISGIVIVVGLTYYVKNKRKKKNNRGTMYE